VFRIRVQFSSLCALCIGKHAFRTRDLQHEQSRWKLEYSFSVHVVNAASVDAKDSLKQSLSLSLPAVHLLSSYEAATACNALQYLFSVVLR